MKLYFAIANVAHDAFISCWETKRYYDSSRPWTLVRHYYAGQKVIGWAGPDGGVNEMSTAILIVDFDCLSLKYRLFVWHQVAGNRLDLDLLHEMQTTV